MFSTSTCDRKLRILRSLLVESCGIPDSPQVGLVWCWQACDFCIWMYTECIRISWNTEWYRIMLGISLFGEKSTNYLTIAWNRRPGTGWWCRLFSHWIGLREILTQNHGFYHEIWGFPANIPLPIQWFSLFQATLGRLEATKQMTSNQVWPARPWGLQRQEAASAPYVL